MRRRLSLPGLAGLAGVTVSAVLAVPAVASAMVPAPCLPATLTPRAASVPANMPGFAYTATNAKDGDVRLTAAGVAQSVVLAPAEGGLVKVTPAVPLVPGTTYRLDWSAVCTYSVVPAPEPFTFVAAPAAPLPTSLGAAPSGVTVTTTDRGFTAFSITARVAVDDAMQPWLSVYQLQVMLDGKAVPTTPVPGSNGQLSLRADGWCSPALAKSTRHVVTVRGRLTFAPTVETAETEIDLTCPATLPGPLPGDPATPPDGTTPPAGGGSSGGAAPTPGTAAGCAVAPGAAPFSLAGLLALASAVSLLARRRAAAATRRT